MNTVRAVLCCALVAIAGCATVVQKQYSDVDWVCREYLTNATDLFDALNLDYPGLEKVKAAVQKKDFPAACNELLAYYKNGESGKWLRKDPPKTGNATTTNAERWLNDEFWALGTQGTFKRFKNGRIDWNDWGPNDENAWASKLNRHYHIDGLMKAYFQTGNEKYIKRLNEDLIDWIVSNPYPQKGENPTVVRLKTYPRLTKTMKPWVVLNAGVRMKKTWPDIFYNLQSTDSFSPAARILMLSSFGEHAHYLRWYHRGDGNHMTTELLGLLRIAVNFPEFKKSGEWIAYVTKIMTAQLTESVYPDGAQKELSFSYHDGVARTFANFAKALKRANYPVPSAVLPTVEKMYDYSVWTLQPDHTNPNNGDSSTKDHAKAMLKRAKTYKHKDWEYILTNGQRGIKPDTLPSKVFPWAGHAVFRSGWDKNAHWLLCRKAVSFL